MVAETSLGSQIKATELAEAGIGGYQAFPFTRSRVHARAMHKPPLAQPCKALCRFQTEAADAMRGGLSNIPDKVSAAQARYF